MCPTFHLVRIYHVATVVAGPGLPLTGAFTSRLHCNLEWHEGSHDQIPQQVSFVRGNLQGSINPGLT